jgi:iron complex outermembrane recepter protein
MPIKGMRAGRRSRFRWLAANLLAACPVAFADSTLVAEPPPAAADIADLSLEELANIQVTSVFRRPERLADAPTSIYVITNEDIRRSGATSLGDALRLAPNLQVARVDSRSYAISARGFNNDIGNKLLVLIDGRTVYSPLFSGVWWDQQDVMLEDVDRIEVISGPGATQWGANAVNGVINVITRRASETQGALLTGTTGRQEEDYGARFGGKIGDTGAYRIYAKAFDRNETYNAAGTPIGDGWHRKQAGFRADWGTTEQGFTLQGDAYSGNSTATALGPPTFSGSNILARWSRRFDDGSDLSVQGYVDRADRNDLVTFHDKMLISDVEAQYGTSIGQSQKVTFGAGYRWARDETDKTLLVTFIPAQRDLRWANAFAQDTIQLSERLQFTAGAKVESNIYTDWEFLPSARLAWKIDNRQMAWGALSRAVRAPARLDRDFFFPGNPPYFINGGPNFVSEIANVAEIGYRAQPTRSTTISISAFYNDYDKLRSGEPPPAVVQNMIDGHATGVEAWGSFQATSAWRLSASFTTLNQHLRVEPGSTDPTGPSALGNDPKYQATLRSTANLGAGIELDIAIRRVAALPNPVVPAYTATDIRVGWHVTRAVELSLTVQNAFDPGHIEFGPAATASEIPRSVLLNLDWKL